MATVMGDLDGVMYPFSTGFHAWAQAEHGRELPIVGNWHFYREWGWHDDFFVAELRRFAAAGGFGDQEPLPGSMELVDSIVGAGHSFNIVTDRPEEGHADTAWWCENYLPSHTTLTFSRDKTVFMQFDDGPYFGIDDRTENVQALLAAGVEAYLYDRPWNEHSTELPRVHSLEEFGAIVLR